MDRNGDGFNTSDEAETYTAVELQAYEIAISDGGRNVFLLISPVVSLVYVLLVFAVVTGTKRLISTFGRGFG